VEQVEVDRFRSTALFEQPGPYGLYGGQVAAQALLAASETVAPDRQPHSLHAYFLRRGETNQSVVYDIDRDRDGASYSARRVVARQGERIILTASLSFHVGETSPDVQGFAAPSIATPDEVRDHVIRSRCFGMEFRDLSPSTVWPLQMWAGATEALPNNPRISSALVTYLSDMYTGIFAFPEADASTNLVSLDHVIWFHRTAPATDWFLMDLAGESIANGRGMYLGRIYDSSGKMVATLAQETLFRATSVQRRELRYEPRPAD
jgi:acyl-CoA thioesterase II